VLRVVGFVYVLNCSEQAFLLCRYQEYWYNFYCISKEHLHESTLRNLQTLKFTPLSSTSYNT